MDVKRLILIFLLTLLVFGNILLCVSPCTKGEEVKVSPAKLTITIDDYPKKEIHYKIKVTNPYSYDLKTTTRVIHPWDLTDNYMMVPDLSWIKILPETFYIPGKSYKEFEVILDIPKNEKILHYNESWEAWIQIMPMRQIDTMNGTGVAMQIQYAVRLFIHTPTGAMETQKPVDSYLLIGIIGGFAMLIAVSFIIKKKRTVKEARTAIFYYKSKEKEDFKDLKKAK